VPPAIALMLATDPLDATAEATRPGTPQEPPSLQRGWFVALQTWFLQGRGRSRIALKSYHRLLAGSAADFPDSLRCFRLVSGGLLPCS
jgi:hypothetical protein